MTLSCYNSGTCFQIFLWSQSIKQLFDLFIVISLKASDVSCQLFLSDIRDTVNYKEVMKQYPL